MGYTAKIMGTRYVVELELQRDQWFCLLKMDGSVEEKVALNQLNTTGLESALDELIARINLLINPIQKKRILEDLMKNSSHLFAKDGYEKGSQQSAPDGIVSEPPVRPSTFSKSQPPQQAAVPHLPSPPKQPSPPQQPTTNTEASEQSLRGGAFNLQQNLISEFRNKISAEDKVEVKTISINELRKENSDAAQIQELVRSHQEVQRTLHELDERVASLEKLTMKLVEITEMMLDSQ